MADYPLFFVFARAAGLGLKALIQMIRIDTAAADRPRWPQTAEAIVKIESAPLGEKDSLFVRGKRIFALEALLDRGVAFDDITYVFRHAYAATLPAELSD